jgi:hypothetical protein
MGNGESSEKGRGATALDGFPGLKHVAFSLSLRRRCANVPARSEPEGKTGNGENQLPITFFPIHITRFHVLKI